MLKRLSMIVASLFLGSQLVSAQDQMGGFAAVPGHEDWTWGAGQSVFAESPDRLFNE